MSDKKATEVIAAIEAATTIDKVNELIVDDTRKTVQEAATKRIEELQAAADAPEDVVEAVANTRKESIEKKLETGTISNPEDANLEATVVATKKENTRKKFLAAQEGVEYNGKKYAFRDHTPATLSFQGKTRTLESLTNDKEAMETLIKGSSGFITFKR